MSVLASVVDVLASLANCFCCAPSTPRVRLHGRSLRLLRLLGQGGFSYVYLAQDASGALFALKKIRCPFGAESVARALAEADAYARFDHPNIIHAVDYAVVDERGTGSSVGEDSGASRDGGDGKTVYILLPYYQRGNLQDAINANLVNHSSFPERHLLALILGVARALKAMHHFREPAASYQPHPLPTDHADSESPENAPLINPSSSSAEPGTFRPYSHRDVKPGNIMIADDGRTPVLMDLGSLAPAPVAVTSRAQALAVQDAAAEHSTMPYRAPELFDVKTGSVIDGAADIWSLGATLFAGLVGKSPFESRSETTGGSLAMCVVGGDWRWPDHFPVSEKTDNIVRRCLAVEPAERPTTDELIAMLEDAVAAA